MERKPNQMPEPQKVAAMTEREKLVKQRRAETDGAD